MGRNGKLRALMKKTFEKKTNILLVLFCILEILFIYGVKIFQYNVGIDTDLFLVRDDYLNWGEIGRFGLIFLKKIFAGGRFNLYVANFCAAFFLLLGAFGWCILFRHYAKTANKFAEFVFCLFYLSSSVWVESNFFTCQSAETSFNVLLCPLCIWLMWEGCRNRKWLTVAGSCILLAFMTSIYQAILPMFGAGVLMVFLLELDQENEDGASEWKILWKVVCAALCAALLYVLANRIFQAMLGDEGDTYLYEMVPEFESVTAFLYQMCYFMYRVFFGDWEFTYRHIDPIIIRFSNGGVKTVENYHSYVNSFSCLLFLPAILVFVGKIFHGKRKQPFRALAGIGILVCAAAFPIVGGGTAPIRTLYSFALAAAFLFYYLILHSGKKELAVWLALVTFFGGLQTFESARLLRCDALRYEMDVWLCGEIDAGIRGLNLEDCERIPVLVLGDYEFDYGENYAAGEVCGNSSITWGCEEKKNEATSRAVSFMQAHGYRYVGLGENAGNIDRLREEAAKMPSYPQEGWVAYTDGVIVVKLSELAYPKKEEEK